MLFVQYEGFQEALRAQAQQMIYQHLQELNVIKEENDKLREKSVEIREYFHSKMDELNKVTTN